jgi:hypothetical protein
MMTLSNTFWWLNLLQAHLHLHCDEDCKRPSNCKRKCAAGAPSLRVGWTPPKLCKTPEHVQGSFLINFQLLYYLQCGQQRVCRHMFRVPRCGLQWRLANKQCQKVTCARSGFPNQHCLRVERSERCAPCTFNVKLVTPL